MKKSIVFALLMLLTLSISACTQETTTPDLNQSENSIVCNENGFEMKLFSDKQTYKTTDSILIWATLEYGGDGDTVKIWHGEPYISFSITDGKDFNVDGIVLIYLTSTFLQKGIIYRFEYQKSGGFDANSPDADYWESFYSEKELRLPEGEYTISVRGEFSLTENVTDSPSNLLCELPIKVVS